MQNKTVKSKYWEAVAEPRNHKGMEIWLPVADSCLAFLYFCLISKKIVSVYFLK